MHNQPDTSKLEDVLTRIPLARTMEISVVHYESGCLRLTAPGEPNRNHFGIAFGGAIECLGTLAGWGLLWLELDDPQLRIVIQHAETTFKTPLQGRLRATAKLPELPEWERFLKQLKRHDRARIELDTRISDTKQNDGAIFRGRYAVARNATA